MKTALLIFAKQPLPGKVKTRLTPPLTPEEACQLYHCMLLDTLSKVLPQVSVDRFLCYVDEGDAAGFMRTISPDTALLPQVTGDLGERMAAAFRQMFVQGYDGVIIIGTDMPDLPMEIIRSACTWLENSSQDVLLGPAEDGGYYLVAMKQLHEELFRDIPWSSDKVLCSTLARASAAGLEIELLPVWYDIDTPEDLRRPELRAEQSPAIRTREFLSRLDYLSTSTS
jgi:rSAM/selenodomain-associated transferase 1